MAKQADRDLQVIRELKPEVSSFHPWLQRLLEKLPHISGIHYTHGSEEVGADFFFEKYDPTLGNTSTVALVVKSGGISQKSADVERQIQECFDIPRTAFREVRSKSVSSVWIVANGKITGGAQRTLTGRFSGRAINFVGEDELASLAREHAPHLLDSLPAEVSSHNAKLRDLVIKEAQRYSLIPADDSVPHIPQRLERFKSRYHEGKRSDKSQTTTLEEVLTATGPPTIIVEGESGSGKSTMVRRCIEDLCEPQQYLDHAQIPIRVEFEDGDSSTERVVELVASQARSCTAGLTLPETKLVVFIDGLEHVVPQAATRLEWIEKLTTQLTDSLPDLSFRIVVATTPLGVAAREGKLASVRYSLQDPTVSDVIQFIKSVCRSVKLSARIFDDIRSSPLFREIRSKPAAAVLLADLLRSNNEADLPTHLTELYDRYAELALGRWLPDGGVESAVYYKAALGFLSGLARRLVNERASEIDLTDYQGLVAKYVRDRNLDIDPEQLAEWILKSHLIAEDREANVLFFRSRMLRDFFAAKFLLARHTEVDLPSEFLDPALACMWFFYFGLRLDCPNDLTTAIEIVGHDRDEQLLKMMLVPQILLAASQTEYTVTEAALGRQLQDAARLYIAARNSRGAGVLKGYSEMDLLWWFQNVLRSHFGLLHFERAVTKLSEDAFAGSDDEEVKYARFFLSVIAMDLKIENPFAPLLDTPGATVDLPAPLLLAVRHEAQSGGIKSSNVKRVLKRLGRIKWPRFTKSSPFSELYDVPLALRKKAEEESLK